MQHKVLYLRVVLSGDFKVFRPIGVTLHWWGWNLAWRSQPPSPPLLCLSSPFPVPSTFSSLGVSTACDLVLLMVSSLWMLSIAVAWSFSGGIAIDYLRFCSWHHVCTQCPGIPIGDTKKVSVSLFHSRLKIFLFCKSFPLQPFLFFFRTDYMDSQTVDCYFWAYLFLLFSLSVLHFLVVGSVRYIMLTHVGFRAHVKIASHIVLYLIVCLYIKCQRAAWVWHHGMYSNRLTRVQYQTGGRVWYLWLPCSLWLCSLLDWFLKRPVIHCTCFFIFSMCDLAKQF